MRQSHLTLLTLLAIALLPAIAQAQLLPPVCGTIREPQGEFCVYKTEGSQNKDVIHFFHGSGADVRNWEKDTATFAPSNIRDAWQRAGVEAPIVVGISFAKSWSLVDRNIGTNPDYFKKFVEKALPEVESHLENPPARRMLMGWSMGGGNASQLLLKKPELFARVALLCPAIVDIAPAQADAVEHLIRVNGTRADLAQDFVAKMLLKFPDLETWLTYSPLDLGRTRLSPKTPPFYVSIGKTDRWGFFKPTEKFVGLARERGAQVTFDVTEGDHCTINYAGAAHFFVQ